MKSFSLEEGHEDVEKMDLGFDLIKKKVPELARAILTRELHSDSVPSSSLTFTIA